MEVLSSVREKWLDLKLQSKLVLSFLFVIVLVIGLIATVIGISTKVFFVDYVRHHNQMRTAELKNYFEGYYQKNRGSWDDIQKVLTEQPLSQARALNRGLTSIDRIILVGAGGTVIADSGTAGTIGKTPPHLDNQTSAALHSGNRLIGTVILGVNPPPGVATLEQNFSKSVTYAIVAASVLAAVLAVALALRFSRRISVPLVSLTTAAGRLAEKDYQYRLPVPSRDEIGKLALAFNTMADAIEKNEQVRNHLVADVAHELRTPITIIRGSLESLQAGVLEPSQEVIVSLHDETLRLSRLINDLQEISLAESGKLPLNRRRANPADLLGKVVNNFKGPALNKEVELTLTVPEICGELDVDYDRIVQVLSNILSNAIRHTPQHGEVRASVTEDRNSISFAIADSGPGIREEDLPYIFDRFYRGSKSRNRADGGTGLGLAIAKSLVDLHQGKIEVTCPQEGGSVFTVQLPKATL